jgi:hypothetical protein
MKNWLQKKMEEEALKNEKKKSVIIERAVRKVCKRGDKEYKYLKSTLEELVKNKTIPIRLLKDVPRLPKVICKTRFDQLYDAAMFLSFPEYDDELFKYLFGLDNFKKNREIKLWKVLIPKKYCMRNILIRAPNFQMAFARACDYVCRLVMKTEKKIPNDLTIRVMYLPASQIYLHKMPKTEQQKAGLSDSQEGQPSEDSEILDVDGDNENGEEENKKVPEKASETRMRKKVNGAIRIALGHSKNNENYKVARYMEMKDLKKIEEAGVVRVSNVEIERELSLSKQELQEINEENSESSE